MNREMAVGILNADLIDILARNRGADDQRRCGRKVVTGRSLVEDVTTGDADSVPSVHVEHLRRAQARQ